MKAGACMPRSACNQLVGGVGIIFACEFVQRRPGIIPQLVNYPFSHKLQNICTKEAVTWFKLVLTSD